MTRRKEAGQVLVLAVAGLGILLMGFAGLGIDVGIFRYEKRLQQTAADAAAIAGAKQTGGVVAGAKAAAAANGFTDGANSVTITVNNGPASGPHASDANYVEVLVAAVHPTFFMRVLGINSETVTARAVATNLSGVNSDCLYLMGNSGLAINGGGNGGIQGPTCGFLDNGDFGTGNSSKWFMQVGSAGVATASSSGGKGNVTCSSGQSACPAFGMPAAANPLAGLTPPAVGAAKTWANGDGPGTYNGMSLGNSKLTLPSGIYVLSGGDFSCGGNAAITGTGVMFYLTNGAKWSCGGNPSVDLTAPDASNCGSCSSQYYGIVIYQDPNDQNTNTMGGTSDYTLNGLVVVSGITMKGTDTLTLGGTSGYGMTALKNTILVE